jgi:hypothetical protein
MRIVGTITSSTCNLRLPCIVSEDRVGMCHGTEFPFCACSLMSEVVENFVYTAYVLSKNKKS